MEGGERNQKKKIKKQAVGGKRERGTQWWVWRMTWKVEGCYWGTAVGRKRGAEGKSRRHGKLSKFTFISARICFKRSSCPHWTFAVWTSSTTGRNKTALLKHQWWRWIPGHWQAAVFSVCVLHLRHTVRAEGWASNLWSSRKGCLGSCLCPWSGTSNQTPLLIIGHLQKCSGFQRSSFWSLGSSGHAKVY